MRLGSQIYIGAKPEAKKIEAPPLDTFWKPRGGLWTSTLNDEGGDWLRWLRDEGYSLEDARWGGQLWQLEPVDANVYEIAHPDQLLALSKEYPYPETLPDISAFDCLVDWPRVAQDYDAVHTPDHWPWRMSAESRYRGASMYFYSLDAESTCWFRWCFEGDPVELDPALFPDPYLAEKGG